MIDKSTIAEEARQIRLTIHGMRLITLAHKMSLALRDSDLLNISHSDATAAIGIMFDKMICQCPLEFHKEFLEILADKYMLRIK